MDSKAWRLMLSWYTSPKCMVRVYGALSSTVSLEHGVLQGYILPLGLFMSHLLKWLESKGLGPSIHETYASTIAHAAGIQTVAP